MVHIDAWKPEEDQMLKNLIPHMKQKTQYQMAETIFRQGWIPGRPIGGIRSRIGRLFGDHEPCVKRGVTKSNRARAWSRKEIQLIQPFAADREIPAAKAAREVLRKGLVNRSQSGVGHMILHLRGYERQSTTPLNDLSRMEMLAHETSAPLAIGNGRTRRWTARENKTLMDAAPDWSHAPRGKVVLIARELKAKGLFNNRSEAAIGQRISLLRHNKISRPQSPTNVSDWTDSDEHILEDNWDDLEYSPHAGAKRLHKRGLLKNHTREAIASKVKRLRDKKSTLAMSPIEAQQKLVGQVTVAAQRQTKPDSRALIRHIAILDEMRTPQTLPDDWNKQIARVRTLAEQMYADLETMGGNVYGMRAAKDKAECEYKKMLDKIYPLYEDFIRWTSDKEAQETWAEMKNKRAEQYDTKASEVDQVAETERKARLELMRSH